MSFTIDVIKIFFDHSVYASPKIIGVKADHRLTDKFFDTIYRGIAEGWHRSLAEITD